MPNLILCFSILFVMLTTNAAAQTVPVPQDFGRAELINNELQKASQWAEKQLPEQTQESFLKKQRAHEEALEKKHGPMDSDPSMYIMTDENWQSRAAHDPEALSQENKKKFAAEQETYIRGDRPADYQNLHELSLEDQDELEIIYRKRSANPHSFELAPEFYHYKYTESIGVKLSGVKGGLAGAWQYRLRDNETIVSFRDLAGSGNTINVFRLEGRFSYGEVDYRGSGTWDGLPDWNVETRGLLGMEVPFASGVTLTPYIGLGHRYLLNELSDIPSQNINGQQYYSGYDRESFYVYIPLGAELKSDLNAKWSAGFKTEFDIFIWGKQVSHLEDMEDQNGVNAGYDKLSNRQKEGYGFRTSARLTRHGGRYDFFIEPFFRFWRIKDSEVEFVTSGGALICQGNLCAAGYEPDNKTWESGINIGAKF